MIPRTLADARRRALGRARQSDRLDRRLHPVVRRYRRCSAEGKVTWLQETDTGAIILIVESAELTAHRRGISSPRRIAGQTGRVIPPAGSGLPTPKPYAADRLGSYT